MMRETLSNADNELLESDSIHMEKAYRLFKKAMLELSMCRRLPWPVVHAMRSVYEVEDTLWQYTEK